MMCSGSTPPACKRSITCCACGAIPLLVVVAHRDLSSLSDPSLQAALASLPEAAQHAMTIVPQPLSVKAVARWLGGFFMPAVPAPPILPR